jgi:hypothetical protein
MKTTTNRIDGLGGDVPTNGADEAIEMQRPYQVEISIQGVCPILFKRWNVEEVEEKSKAKKGSDIKKQDNPENAIARNEKGLICIPGEYFRQSMIGAAKFIQDPRSSRKSAKDLVTAALFIEDELSVLLTADGKPAKDWEYLDKRRAQVNRGGINRVRPAFHKGWKANFIVVCNLPEYVSQDMLHRMASDAGRFNGVGDFRPTYGRFIVTKFKPLELEITSA